MPEQPNRAHYHDESDPLAEMERIVTESIASSRPSHRPVDAATPRREAHDPQDFPRRDTSWRNPQVRTTVRAGVTPQPGPDQLADIEALLSSDPSRPSLDATVPQYGDRTTYSQATRTQTGTTMAGQVRGNTIGGDYLPDDEMTLPMHAVLRHDAQRPPAPPQPAPRMTAPHDEFNAYGRDPHEAHDMHASHDPAGAMGGAHYDDYAHEEAAFYEDEAQAQAHATSQHAAYYAQHSYEDDDYYPPQAAPTRARRSATSPFLFGGAIAAVVLILGGGGYYALKSGSRADVTGSGIPLIRADTKPVKEMAPPAQPTQVASTGPNLDVARDGQDKLVSQTEDPVDKIPVKPQVRVVGTQSTSLAPVQHVHSVIVRPDGSIVSPETTASTTPPVPQPTPAPAPVNVVRTATTTPTDAPAAPAPEVQKTLPPLSPPAQIATAPVAAPVAQPKPVVPAPVVAARPNSPPSLPAPVAPLPASSYAPRLVKPAPTPEAAPLALSPTQSPRVATAPQATAPSQRPAPVEAASGEFMVQISSARSDTEAHHALQAAVAKYGALGVHGGDVQPADLGARGMFYRARLNGGTRDQAAQLCSQIKAQGGDCVVAKR